MEGNIQMPSYSMPQQTLSAARRRNLPCGDLLGNTVDYFKYCVPLYEASMRGDWKAAEVILDERPELVRFSISENHDTALHVAASAKSTKLVERFVEKLVNRMNTKDLELRNENDNTALCIAAAAGNGQIAETMLEKNEALKEICGSQNMTPLHMASSSGELIMVCYLYDRCDKMSGGFWNNENRDQIFKSCVEADLFYPALTIVTDHPELVRNASVLGALARKTDAFEVIHGKFGSPDKPSYAMKLLSFICEQLVTLSKDEINDIIRGPADIQTTPYKETQDVVQLLRTGSENIPKVPIEQHEYATYSKLKYSSHVLFIATEMGNTEFVVTLLNHYPDLIWRTNDSNQTIFHVAVSHRQEGIYSLLHEIGSMKDRITTLKDNKGNNMLHLVGKSAKGKQFRQVSGVTQQMHLELLWFKEVEAMVPPPYREMKNNDGLRPYELFTKEHKDLMSKNEELIKEAASQSLVVATLLASIGFAAAITAPGGYDQNDGTPLFLHKRSFIVFVLADGISLIWSCNAILSFIAIFTFRNNELDFMGSLPRRMQRGTAAILHSIAAMVVAFCASFYVLYGNKLIWVPIFMSIFASMPIILYLRLQYDLIRTMYSPVSIFKSLKLKLYNQDKKI